MRPPLDIHTTAYDIEQRGRHSYVVVERVSSGLDMEFTPGHWFRWTAIRHARKRAAQTRRSDVVFSVKAPCHDCGAPRINGIRTCGVTCARGVDPRLADHLGIPRWQLTGRTSIDVEEQP